MKKTSVLGVKRWMWSRFNPPLPQTPRESQQLLSALTSSFRRQLDAADTNKPAQSADQHLQTILQHPLFRVVPPKPSVSALGLEDDKARLKKKMAETPMDFFDELAAAGILSIADIRACLNAQLALLGTTSKDRRDQMKMTGAGKKVLDWFWATDPSIRLDFLRSARTFPVAVRFMVAEGLYDQINSIIRELGQLDLRARNMSPDDGMRMFGSVFRSYTDAEINYGRGLAAALQTFNMFCSETELKKQKMFVFSTISIGRFMLKRKESEQLRTVPASVFDEFCKHLDKIPGLRFWPQAIRLYHPSHPDALPLLGYALGHHDYETSSHSDTEQGDMIQVYLDAMRLLIEQKKHKDALRLSTHIEEILSEQQEPAVKTYDHSPELSELMVRANLALG